jgi:hypothetical protein
MATITPQRSDNDSSEVPSSPQLAFDVEGEAECADFELDVILRGLALDRWFATAEKDVPIWAF